MSRLSYKELIDNQLPIDLYKSGDIESKAIGNSLDKIQGSVDILEREINPLTAYAKGLEQWESFFKLPSNEDEGVEIRRARVISELIQFMSDESVIRKDEMESILSLFGKAEIIEYFLESFFEIVFTKSEDLNINEIQKVVKAIKPSWLSYRVLIQQISGLILSLKAYDFDVPYKICNMFTTDDIKGGLSRTPIQIGFKAHSFNVPYPICNMFTTASISMEHIEEDIVLEGYYKDNEVLFKRTGNTTAGEGDI